MELLLAAIFVSAGSSLLTGLIVTLFWSHYLNQAVEEAVEEKQHIIDELQAKLMSQPRSTSRCIYDPAPDNVIRLTER